MRLAGHHSPCEHPVGNGSVVVTGCEISHVCVWCLLSVVLHAGAAAAPAAGVPLLGGPPHAANGAAAAPPGEHVCC